MAERRGKEYVRRESSRSRSERRSPQSRPRTGAPRRSPVELIPLSGAVLSERSPNGYGRISADPVSSPDEPSPAQARSDWAELAASSPLLLVLGAFLGTLFIIPVFATAPVGDDWVYARSVETLLRATRIEILDLSVVTLVFQVVWGAFFSLLFELSFGAMRLSTVALIVLSGAALYGICRELGVQRGRAALGTAAYLFNPLTFVLAFTFMTDAQFTALLVIASYFYVRGLNPARLDRTAIILGSVVASLAFLTRQQGVLIPLAVGTYLLLSRRWRLDGKSMKLTALVAGLPVATVLLYYAWLFNVHGAPEQQSAFLSQMTEAGWTDTRVLTGRMTYIETVYLGFFILPIALSALPSITRWRLPSRWPSIALLLAWTAILLIGLQIFGEQGRFMPYIPQFVGVHGVGPTDLIGGREALVGQVWRNAITTLCATAVFVFILLVAGKMDDRRATASRAGAGLVATIALWQVIGILPPSFHFRNWIISVDRYLLPIVPFGIVLLLWATRDLRLARGVGWLAVTAYALFAIVATRDFLVFQETTWSMAHTAIEMGVPLTRLDAGASWDGYYLYEYSLANNIPQQTPSGPWWTNLFGPATDSTYVVASGLAGGYDAIYVREYSSWSHEEPQLIYLLRRQGVPGPP